MIVDLPDSSTVAPLTHPPQCPSINGCFEIALATQPNATQWFMFGHPFSSDVVWNSLRVTTLTGECAETGGCTLAKAAELNIIQNQAWRYNPQTNDYTIIQNEATLHSWEGLWMSTLNMAHDLSPILLVPR